MSEIELLIQQITLLEMENSKFSQLCIIQLKHIENLNQQKEQLEEKIREILSNHHHNGQKD